LSEGWNPFAPIGRSRRRPTETRSGHASRPKRRAGSIPMA
jgi:hypothetical protein